MRSINSRSSVALIVGFGILIGLIGALGFGAIRRVNGIYAELQAVEDAYLKNEAFRRGIATDMFLADILVRDYLLDPSSASGPSHRQELLTIRGSLQERLDVFVAKTGDTSPDLKALRSEVEGYWESLDPIFEWNAREKAERTEEFLARRVLTRREAVVRLAREMSRLNHANLQREQERISSSQALLHRFLVQMTVFVLVLGAAVAFLTTRRVMLLENMRETQRRQIEETQNNLRRLSNRLVQSQESERKDLSRELHDEVGQMMTAVGIELGYLENVRDDRETFSKRLEDLKRLNADSMRAVRDLAMGLRPSMLDDIGLEAALEWQGREFSRHTGVPARVQVEGTLDDLADAQRTCIYRVVQEALTNCARHARATNVLVAVTATDDGIVVAVRDNGIGFINRSSTRAGLGLLGIQERVQALDGRVIISSKPMEGTTLEVRLPAGVAA